MKRLLLVLALAALVPAAVWADVMYVQVSKTRLLEKASAFSKSKAPLAYKTRVEVLGKQGAYYRVKTPHGSGYVPTASLSVKKPQFTSSLSRDYVSSDEVAVATKGFNAQVESDYRAKNPNLPYDALDKMIAETTYPDPGAKFKPFRKQGKLGEYREGGEQE